MLTPRSLLLASLVLTACAAAAQPPSPHPIDLNDLAKIRRVGDPRISPDGQWIAYTVRSVDSAADKNVTHLWMVSWDGKNDIQETQDDYGASSLRWSPDGRFLSFLSARPGPANGSQVWTLDVHTGLTHQITNVKQQIVDYRWSPDAKQLLLTLRDTKKVGDAAEHTEKTSLPQPIVITRYQYKDDHEGYLTDQRDHLYLFDLDTLKLTRLLCEPYDDEAQDAEWSPDGRHIAFLSQRAQARPDRTENSDLFLVDAKPGSTPRKLTAFQGVEAGPLAWSANSKLIAYRQARFPGYSSYTQLEVAVISAAGGPAHLLGTTLDRTVGPPLFTKDDTALLTSVIDDRNLYVERMPLDGSAPQRITHGDGVVYDLASTAGHTAVEWSTDTTMPELYAMGGNGALRKLTHQNDALLATLALQPAQDIAAHTRDGNDVHGLLTMPSGYKAGERAPMLLYIHGGPTEQDAHDFNLSRQVFAAHGYAVLNVNYRGSNGRGYQYSRAIQADWGDKELIDLEAMVDAAIATGTIDPNRLAVGGWSYGGILTDDLIARTTRFKAASSGAGRGDLIGLYGVSEYVLQYDSELGQPWDHPELYLKLSYPFFHANQIKTPTLFLGGDRDFNVPLAGSEQMYEALRSVGTPTELIIYPGQHHVFTRPSFVRDRYQRWFDWYDPYLGLTAKKPATAPVPSCK